MGKFFFGCLNFFLGVSIFFLKCLYICINRKKLFLLFFTFFLVVYKIVLYLYHTITKTTIL